MVQFIAISANEERNAIFLVDAVYETSDVTRAVVAFALQSTANGDPNSKASKIRTWLHQVWH
jgi:hypothetical protein